MEYASISSRTTTNSGSQNVGDGFSFFNCEAENTIFGQYQREGIRLLRRLKRTQKSLHVS